MKEWMIHPKRLFYFGEVFKRGSINAAADHLNMVQAGIGRQIQFLEQELGVLLFERGTNGRGMVTGGRGRGMVPTEAAQLVYDFYCKYCDQQDKLMVALEELHQMKRGEIRIVMPDSHIDLFYDIVLESFYQKHSHINVCIEEVNSSIQILNKILDDSAHIGMLFHLTDEPNIRYCARKSLPIVMLVSKEHPLAKKEKVTLAEMVGYPLALPPPSFNFRKMLTSLERSEKIQLTAGFISDSVSALKKFASSGHRGTLLSICEAYQEVKEGRLIALTIDHPAFLSAEARIIVRRGKLFSPAANQLLRLITAKFSDAPLVEKPLPELSYQEANGV